MENSSRLLPGRSSRLPAAPGVQSAELSCRVPSWNLICWNHHLSIRLAYRDVLTQWRVERRAALHAFLLRRHFREGLLVGPDYGVRFNFRAWRFLKSALNFIPWHDDCFFMQ